MLTLPEYYLMSQRSIDPYAIDMFVDEIEITEVADSTYYFSAFSGVTAFETSEGLVLIDTGLSATSATMAEALREYTDASVHTAIYTHGHLDHAFNLDDYLVSGQDSPNVIAHQVMPNRFDRYEQTVGHNDAINSRQFGGTTSGIDELDDLAESSQFGWPEYPPTTIYDDNLTIQVGDITLELHHARGETDDHSWVYCPEREVLCPGDFVIGVAPNAGNPQKVQRYPWEWADALREMTAVDAETLCPGHGRPIIDDSEEIRRRLLRSAEYLDTIVERTLDTLNDGSPPHVDIIRDVELPDPDEPWLQEVYDDGEFIVRNVLRYYGGWWSGRPSELKPASRDALAEEITALAGGVETLVSRAEEFAADGDSRIACHLADYALEAAPDNKRVQSVVADIYEQRAEAMTDLMSKNIFSSAAEYANEGRRFR
ncbi:alkyl sulfatase dimerization domain-containing protein [Halomarina halobia]|uniref:Alkyl sulfatase dimerization domain-containing protein n=1 Tax=Halomarina halobia TaxID=3033386 RepID=A0ABD6AEM5_9EURY|nr:alkyl sulfatase dimerization domain-containing protein [Halomarina sp. PSR21]